MCMGMAKVNEMPVGAACCVCDLVLFAGVYMYIIIFSKSLKFGGEIEFSAGGACASPAGKAIMVRIIVTYYTCTQLPPQLASRGIFKPDILHAK